MVENLLNGNLRASFMKGTLSLRKSNTFPTIELEEAIKREERKKITTKLYNFFSFLTTESPIPTTAKKNNKNPNKCIPEFKLTIQDSSKLTNLSPFQICQMNK